MSEFRVALRHTTLLDSAALVDRGDDQFFIATAAPPPTNSILTLDGEGERQFFLVDKVIEVEADDQPRGVLGKLTDAQAHKEASKLGTEHLEDGKAPVDEPAPAMAMPAPVVDPDPTEEVDLGERARLETDGEAVAVESSSNDQEGSDDGEDETSGGRRKKRRRKRK